MESKHCCKAMGQTQRANGWRAGGKRLQLRMLAPRWFSIDAMGVQEGPGDGGCGEGGADQGPGAWGREGRGRGTRGAGRRGAGSIASGGSPVSFRLMAMETTL